MREKYRTYQQLKLLEDHTLELAGGTEACPDCLFKHTNAVIAYATEVATLVPENEKQFWLNIAENARKMRKQIFETEGIENLGNPKYGHPGGGKRLYEPYGLTTQERKDKMRAVRAGGCTLTPKNRYCRLVRCIKEVEPKEDQIESAAAVCRTSIYGR